MICPFFSVAMIATKQYNNPSSFRDCHKVNCAAWGEIGMKCINPEAHYSEHKYESIFGCKLCQPNANGFYGGFNYGYPYNSSYENCCDSNMNVGENKESE